MYNKIIALLIVLILILPIMADFLSIKPASWDIGELLIREKRFTTEKNSLIVENIHSEKSLFMGIRLKNSGDIKPGRIRDNNTFVLCATFCDIGEDPGGFHPERDIVLLQDNESPWVGRWTSRRFGPGGKISPGSKQMLRFEFTAPLDINTEYGEKEIVVEICARDKDENLLECRDIVLNADIRPIPQAILDKMRESQR